MFWKANYRVSLRATCRIIFHLPEQAGILGTQRPKSEQRTTVKLRPPGKYSSFWHSIPTTAPTYTWLELGRSPSQVDMGKQVTSGGKKGFKISMKLDESIYLCKLYNLVATFQTGHKSMIAKRHFFWTTSGQGSHTGHGCHKLYCSPMIFLHWIVLGEYHSQHLWIRGIHDQKSR